MTDPMYQISFLVEQMWQLFGLWTNKLEQQLMGLPVLILKSVCHIMTMCSQ